MVQWVHGDLIKEMKRMKEKMVHMILLDMAVVSKGVD